MTEPTTPAPAPGSAGAPAAGAPAGTAPQSAPGAPRASRSAGWLVGALALLVAALAVGVFFLARPTLVFTNALAAPVHVTVNRTTRTVAPGAAARFRVPRDLLVVQWELVRPLSADDQPMGEEMKGSWALRDPRGRLERRAEFRSEGGDYFAPLVSNATSGLLRITVNAGLEGARDCGCAVRAGASRVFIGYYRLYGNSTVQATDAAGRTATFRDLGPAALARGGTVGLRFAADNFGAGR